MRALERDAIQLFFGCIMALVAVAFLQDNAHAAIKNINCQTAFGEKSFTIQESSIAFHAQEESGRSISSTLEAQTQKTYQGFRKVLYMNGNKHLIRIKNVNKFDNTEDYLAVTSPRGHKMTYPLSCALAE